MNRIPLKPGLSLYLDVLRLTLALTVVVYHASTIQVGGGWYKFPLGVSAVVGFFVLSGFVIAYVAANKDTDASAYAAARLARLWSVLLPALVLTPLFDAIGRMFAPSVYEGWGIYLAFDHPLVRLGIAAAFLNELWFWSIAPLSNSPVWSLGFEAWYYVIFGAIVFLRGKKQILTLAIIGLIVGPKILLLFLPWAIGALLYLYSGAIYDLSTRYKWGSTFGLLLFSVCPIAIVVLKMLHVEAFLLAETDKIIDPAFSELYLKFARLFLWENLVGLLIGLHIVGAIIIADALNGLLAPAAKMIRVSAAYTFSIYLLHNPIEMMVAAMLHDHPNGPVKTSIVIGLAIAIAVCIGALIEPQRYLLRRHLLRVFKHFGKAHHTKAGTFENALISSPHGATEQ